MHQAWNSSNGVILKPRTQSRHSLCFLMMWSLRKLSSQRTECIFLSLSPLHSAISIGCRMMTRPRMKKMRRKCITYWTILMKQQQPPPHKQLLQQVLHWQHSSSNQEDLNNQILLRFLLRLIREGAVDKIMSKIIISILIPISSANSFSLWVSSSNKYPHLTWVQLSQVNLYLNWLKILM